MPDVGFGLHAYSRSKYAMTFSNWMLCTQSGTATMS